MFKNRYTLFVLLMVAVFSSGCSVKQAAFIKHSKYEVDLLSFGRPRTHVIQQIGEPASSRQVGNYRVDTYEMSRNSKGWGIVRSGGYALLDVATIGFWELIGTPLEAWIQQDQTVTIYYDDLNHVDRVQYTRN